MEYPTAYIFAQCFAVCGFVLLGSLAEWFCLSAIIVDRLHVRPLTFEIQEPEKEVSHRDTMRAYLKIFGKEGNPDGSNP